MSLFDIFKGNNKEKQDHTPLTEPYFLEALKARISSLGYQANIDQHKNAVVLDNGLEIAAAVYTPESTHWTLAHVRTVISHPTYFPAGIKENIDGMGVTLDKRVNTGIENYLLNTLLPVMECLTGKHNARFDLLTPGGKVIHSNPGCILYPGRWITYPEGEPIFDLLKEPLQKILMPGIFNWIRVSVSKYDDEVLGGECLLNNEPWPEGMDILTAYAKTWPKKGDIIAAVQFIIFR